MLDSFITGASNIWLVGQIDSSSGPEWEVSAKTESDSRGEDKILSFRFILQLEVWIKPSKQFVKLIEVQGLIIVSFKSFLIQQ